MKTSVDISSLLLLFSNISVEQLNSVLSSKESTEFFLQKIKGVQNLYAFFFIRNFSMAILNIFI